MLSHYFAIVWASIIRRNQVLYSALISVRILCYRPLYHNYFYLAIIKFLVPKILFLLWKQAMIARRPIAVVCVMFRVSLITKFDVMQTFSRLNLIIVIRRNMKSHARLTFSLKIGCIFILLTVFNMATARNLGVVYGKYTLVWKYTR